MNRKLTALAGAAAMLAALAGGMACAAEPGDTARRVEDLLRQMTLEEKVGQLNQLSGKEFLTGPGSQAVQNMEADIRSGKVGSMLNIKGVAETRRV